MDTAYKNKSLNNRINFFNKLGNIQNKIPNIIHVAGTNGKGSTIAFMKSILENKGFSVNVFTSPHLVKYNERFTIKGQYISDIYLQDITQRLEKQLGYNDLLMFEKATAIAFIAFFENIADYTIIEVGLGGILDATNIIKKPILQIISSISLDHQQLLGETIEEIAMEKSGIIKGGITVTTYQVVSVYNIIKTMSHNKESKLIAGGRDYKIQENSLWYKEREISLRDLALEGEHQKYNASLAIISLLQIMNCSNAEISKGLQAVEWHARLQKVDILYGIDFLQQNARVYLDGAHNSSGAEALANFIKYDKNIHLIVGMLKTKRLADFLNKFAALQSKSSKIKVYPLHIEGHDSFLYEDFEPELQKINLHGMKFNNTKEALIHICKDKEEKTIVICGSLYLLGAILAEQE